ncbi:outer membrane lipoprotein NodT family [Janthinobacterium sp. HH01]|uniref:efflux transporter outer membrane subunit n=1 Tax=Janthinobacterium sp. HH01 TaxID=1198452 RepID=UPI0002AED477|nr:TolC family protein [Janthinobacterium sp. HH01]ELX13520.1 outer membrane lipoprotein NodT family [Janthinobacterium sp. HH01]
MLFNAKKSVIARLALALAAASALAACAGGPARQQPAPRGTEGGAFINLSTQVDGGTPPPADWWKLYDDAALDTLVAQALAANTDVRAALAHLERARAVHGEARAALLPSTSLSASANRARDQGAWSGPGRAPIDTSYRGGVDIAYEVDLFGRVGGDIDAALGDAQAAAAAAAAAKVVVVAETTRAYADACALGQSVDVARSGAELAQQAADMIALRQRAGSASRLDVARAAAALARAEAALPPLQARREAAWLELAALTGRAPAEAPSAVRACVKPPAFTGRVPVGDGAAMLRRRPDVRQAERQLAAATARIGVAVAELYPRVELGASASYLRNDTLRGERALSFGFGPLISWTFPNTAAARSRVAQAGAQGAAALARFDGAVLTALKETEQALSRYQGATLRRDALLQARQHAETALGLAERLHLAGSIAYLDVLLARNDYIGAQAAVAAADQEAGAARVDLFKALGGGWQSSATD